MVRGPHELPSELGDSGLEDTQRMGDQSRALPSAPTPIPKLNQRDLNASLLIELTRRAKSISRAELARQSRLSAPTVSTIVDGLLDREILIETFEAPSSGGRPPVLLSLNAHAGYVVGIKLRGDGLTTVVCDLDVHLVATTESLVQLAGDPDAAIRAIEQEIGRALELAAVPRSKVLGVGIGLSGLIDANGGICVSSPLLGWRDVDLADPLRQRTGLPVWIDNDVNALTVAEKWAEENLDARNFVVLTVGRGIGAGIVIDRSLYRGANGGAGEFGHMVVEPSGPKCECGRFGCLEAFVGEAALRRRVSERLGGDVSRDQLVSLVAHGDAAALDVIEKAGRQLGLAVANMISLLNPEMLIICGEGTELGSGFIDPIVAAVRQQTFAGTGEDLRIVVQRWRDDAWAVGAATLVLRESFNPSGSDGASRPVWRRPVSQESIARKRNTQLKELVRGN
jgi:N-acetylglucosamine repressor